MTLFISDRLQTRRKVGLETLSLVASLGSAVFFSGLFIANWSIGRNLLTTAAAAVGLVLYWSWHRARHPANISPPKADTSDEVDDDDDSLRKWEWYWILALAVSSIGVVIVGLITSFFLALLVVAAFAGGYNDVSDAGDVLRASLAMLAVSAVTEFAIVMPLCRLWNLDFDADPEPRSAYCPSPSQQP